MANPDARVDDDAAELLRIGIAATAGGFWLVSLAPVIVAGSDVHGLVMAFWRSWIGGGILAMVLALRGGLTPQLLRPTAPAGLCFGLSIGLFFWASQITSIANASLITVLQPIPLMVAAYFVFSERLVASDLVFAAVAISGALVLVTTGDSGGTGDIRGDALALISIIIGAGYFVFAKRVLVSVSVVAFMVGMFVWAGLALTPLVLLSGERILPSTGGDWVKVLAVAILPGAGHLLLNYSHGKAPLNLMGVIQLLIPVNATLMAFWFLDQSVSLVQVVGMAVVITALAVHAIIRSRTGAG